MAGNKILGGRGAGGGGGVGRRGGGGWAEWGMAGVVVVEEDGIGEIYT